MSNSLKGQKKKEASALKGIVFNGILSKTMLGEKKKPKFSSVLHYLQAEKLKSMKPSIPSPLLELFSSSVA